VEVSDASDVQAAERNRLSGQQAPERRARFPARHTCKYRGTIRESGLQLVNPFTERIKVSTRIRNQESAQAKVNDADGNPIEIAAVVVWQVRDTANAVYSVDDFTQFVTIYTETAVRHIASSYPCDNRGSGRLSLRDNADEITQQLSAELTVRVRPARVDTIESRLTGCPTPPRSPRPCCARSRPARSSARCSASTKALSAWCSWPCAASRRPSPSSTPARSTSDRGHGNADGRQAGTR
jgi:SPFH domain / Band 7 family